MRKFIVILLLAAAVSAQQAKKVPTLRVLSRNEMTSPNSTSLAREPMIVEHPGGTLFVAGYGSNNPNDTPRLWRSTDRGRHWEKVNVGTAAEGAIGNSDVDLALAPDGRLYFVSMGFDRATSQGTHITVGVSKDAGATWKWSVLTRQPKVDRPWVAVAHDGTAYVIWNDGASVFCATSKDGGATWATNTVSSKGGGSSHLVVGSMNEIAVRLTPVSQSGAVFTPGRDRIAVSTDGGKTWTDRAAPGERDWVSLEKFGPNDTPRWVEPLAWADDGTLYSLWTTKDAVWLAGSKDAGETWKQWKIASCAMVCYFPYLVVRGNHLAATWSMGLDEKQEIHVARIVLGTSGPLVIPLLRPFNPNIWSDGDKPTDPQQRGTGGEYYAATFLQDGTLAVVTPVRNKRKTKFGFTLWRFR